MGCLVRARQTRTRVDLTVAEVADELDNRGSTNSPGSVTLLQAPLRRSEPAAPRGSSSISSAAIPDARDQRKWRPADEKAEQPVAPAGAKCVDPRSVSVPSPPLSRSSRRP